MTIGLLLPGFGHVYCGKKVTGLMIFFAFIFILQIGGIIGLYSLYVGLTIALVLTFLLELIQLVYIQKTVDEYNRVIMISGSPPW